MVNGVLTERVSITRSVRQGCPLAPALYAMIIQPGPARTIDRSGDDIKALDLTVMVIHWITMSPCGPGPQWMAHNVSLEGVDANYGGQTTWQPGGSIPV